MKHVLFTLIFAGAILISELGRAGYTFLSPNEYNVHIPFEQADFNKEKIIFPLYDEGITTKLILDFDYYLFDNNQRILIFHSANFAKFALIRGLKRDPNNATYKKMMSFFDIPGTIALAPLKYKEVASLCKRSPAFVIFNKDYWRSEHPLNPTVWIGNKRRAYFCPMFFSEPLEWIPKENDTVRIPKGAIFVVLHEFAHLADVRDECAADQIAKELLSWNEADGKAPYDHICLYKSGPKGKKTKRDFPKWPEGLDNPASDPYLRRY